MISSHVKISMISLISSLSLKLYLNSLVHHRNIFGSSSKVFGNCNFRQSSEILGKCSETFVWPSERFWKIFGKSSKTPSSVCLYNKKNIFTLAQRYEFYVLVARTVSHCSCHSNIKFISSRHRVISSIVYSYSRFWTRTSMLWRLMPGNIIKKILMSFQI